MSIKNFTYKIIKSGCEIEIYGYEESQMKKLDKSTIDRLDEEVEKKPKPKQKELVNDENYKRRAYDIALIKKKIKRIVNANIRKGEHTDKFLTLTFEGEPPKREYVVKQFNEFKRRFLYKYKYSFDYLAVVERGKQGTERLHMHLICFGFPYIKQRELQELWGNGWLYIEETFKTKDPADYMVKYIEKTLETNDIEKGKRFYFTSRNLRKPDELYFTDDEFLDYIDNNDLGYLKCQLQFESVYVGACTYTKYVQYQNNI